jgi:TolB-like protein
MRLSKADNRTGMRQMVSNWRILGVLALGFVASAHAQVAAKPTLTVLPTQVNDIPESDARAFTSEIERSFRSNPDVQFVPVNTSNLTDESGAKGCQDVECATQAGRQLDAERVVAPMVRKDGGGYVMTLRLVDARSGEQIASKAGMSASGSASGAASDFGAALSEPLVAALHVVDQPVVASTTATTASGDPNYKPLSNDQKQSENSRQTKILLYTLGGMVVAGGIAAAVLLMGSKSGDEATNNPNGGGGANSSDLTVSVSWGK